MTRPIAASLGRALIAHAMGDKYPTRAMEYLLGWLMLGWSVRVALPGDMMSGPAFRYFLAVAPEWLWGAVGVAVAGLRIFALIRNGGWAPGPLSRTLGAAAGFNFWFALGAFYTLAVWDGAPDFPMRIDFFVLSIAELFCLARCAQVYAVARAAAAPVAAQGS